MISEQMQQATFKGVPFYWKKLRTKLGKDSVSHEYAGSSRRFVEDMGQFPKVFTIEAEIGGGDAYLNNKQALEAAISSEGAGLLVHPTYGQVQCMAKPATCVESLEEVGIAKYTLTFEKTELEIRPSDTEPTLRKVEQKKTDALGKLATAAADNFTVPTSPSFFDKAVSQINSLTESLSAAAGSIASVRDDAWQVFTAIEALEDAAADLVTQPLALYNDLIAIYGEVMGIDDFIEDQFRRVSAFFGDESDSGPTQGSPNQGAPTEKPIETPSYESQASEDNRKNTNEASNLCGLINIYVVIVKIDFTSTEDLDDAIDFVEDKFQMMADSALMQTPVRDDVIELRNTAMKVLDAKRLSTKKIVTRDLPNDTPLAVALFDQQGTIDDIEFIIGLNPQQDVVFAAGETRLLE